MKRTLILGYLCIAVLFFISVSCSNNAEELNPITTSSEGTVGTSYFYEYDWYSPFFFEIFYSYESKKFEFISDERGDSTSFAETTYSNTIGYDNYHYEYYMHLIGDFNTFSILDYYRWYNTTEDVLCYLKWKANFDIYLEEGNTYMKEIVYTSDSDGRIFDLTVNQKIVSGRIQWQLIMYGEEEFIMDLSQSPYNKRFEITFDHSTDRGTQIIIPELGVSEMLPIDINPFAFEFQPCPTRIYGVRIISL